MGRSTMRLYTYLPSNGYEMLDFYDGDDSKTLGNLNGEPQAQTWRPLRVRRVRMTARAAFRPSDSPYHAIGTIVFRRTAVDALRDILDAHGELLPVKDDGGVELFVYNPRTLDALDHERTKGGRDENGRITTANNHVFVLSVVEGVDAFRQARERYAWIFLSDRFIQRWKQAKLKGLDFTLAWDSDLPPEAQPNVWTSKPIKL